MKAYQAIIVWSGKNHAVQKHKHARPGMKFPATCQTYAKPRGAKITTKYSTPRMERLHFLNGPIGSWFIRRIGGYLFNQAGNQLWAKKWTKLLGVQARVPYPMPEGQFAVAQGILCETNIVTVVEEKSGYCRILPTMGRLVEVEVGSGKRHGGTLVWPIYADDKTKQIWIEKKRLEKLVNESK